MANYLIAANLPKADKTTISFANTARSDDGAALEVTHTYVAAAIRRSFVTFNADWLIATPPENTSYDDLMWWALAYIRAHELCLVNPELMPCTVPRSSPAADGAFGASSRTLLEEAKLIYDYTYNKSWNDDFCGGGFCWALKAQNYKNCVTNQQGVLVASKLATLIPSTSAAAVCNCKAHETYAQIALRTSGWLSAAPMRNTSSKLFNDGLYVTTTTTSSFMSV
jgi:predicted alpha-1,6-mannanase (GH76 family)